MDNYINKLRPLWKQSFLKSEVKLAKLTDKYEKLRSDVFFFQEFDSGVAQSLEKKKEFYVQL